MHKLQFKMRHGLSASVVSLVLALLLAGCGGSGGSDGPAGPRNLTADDFRTLQDFVDDPRVKDLLARANLVVHLGSTPPNVEGVYTGTAKLEIHDVHPSEVGRIDSWDVTLDRQSGEDIRYSDSNSAVAVDTRAFITGSGDHFTIWRVVVMDLLIVDCILVVVDVLTGRVLPGGDLDARYGEVNVGWHGTECAVLGDPAPLGSHLVWSVDATFVGPP